MKVMNLLQQNLNLYIIHIDDLMMYILLVQHKLFDFLFENKLEFFFQKIMLVINILLLIQTKQHRYNLMLNVLNDDDNDNELDNSLQYIDQMQSLINPLQN